MKEGSLKSYLVLTGAIIFNIIFWNEKLGINAVMFDSFIIAMVFYLYPGSLKNRTAWWLVAANIFSVAMVIVHNTLLSKLAFSATLLLFVCFAQYMHRSVWYAGGSALANYVFGIPAFISQLYKKTPALDRKPGIGKSLRILIVPILILGLFVLIYSWANNVFAELTADFFLGIQNWFSNFFDWFSWTRFLFFLLGIFITAGLLIRSKYNYFSEVDLRSNDDLARKHNVIKRWKETAMYDLSMLIVGKRSSGILAIKTEYLLGLISLILLNILLLFINILDIRYVWFGFNFTGDINLAEYVHEGAGILIFSIILAMLVLLIFFRANLNFYKKNKWLKYAAYLWILQNLILVISVLIRDYYYISHYGLAYKRIGLLFFLFMVLTGLVTVFLKIREIKTSYYLMRVNAWAGITLLVLSSAIHWDELIAKYNLERKASIPLDIAFLLNLSDKTLPILEQNKDILNQQEYFPYNGDHTQLSYFQWRKRKFLEEQKEYSWLSWNAADAYVLKELKNTTTIATSK